MFFPSGTTSLCWYFSHKNKCIVYFCVCVCIHTISRWSLYFDKTQLVFLNLGFKHLSHYPSTQFGNDFSKFSLNGKITYLSRIGVSSYISGPYYSCDLGQVAQPFWVSHWQVENVGIESLTSIPILHLNNASWTTIQCFWTFVHISWSKGAVPEFFLFKSVISVCTNSS